VFTPLLKREYLATSLRGREPKSKPNESGAMKIKQQTNESNDATNHGAVVKTLSLQVAITETDLSQAVRQAFDLAKGAGRELNLAFNLQPGS
jgi:hypothetical protein